MYLIDFKSEVVGGYQDDRVSVLASECATQTDKAARSSSRLLDGSLLYRKFRMLQMIDRETSLFKRLGSKSLFS